MMEEHDEADEVTQEVFIKLYNSAGEFRGDSTLYTWLYRITTNTCLNALRKKKNKRFLKLEDVEEVTTSDEMMPDNLIEKREEQYKLEKAIDSLPAKQKAVFVLRYYEEKSYEEISKITNTSVGGLKANYFHALKKIGAMVRSK